MKKISNIFIISILVFTLLSVPAYWLLRTEEVRQSVREGRWVNTFEKIKLDFQDFKTGTKRILQGKIDEAQSIFYGQWLDHTYQASFEQAATDQFPLRIQMIDVARWLERGVIKTVYLFNDDVAIPTYLEKKNLVLRNAPVLLGYPGYFGPETKKVIDARVNNFSEIIEQNPGVNFYVLYVDEIVQSPGHPLNSYFPNADRGQSIQYFEEKKPQSLVLEKWMINSLEEYQEYFYHTDHHWNTRGMWKAYEQIYHMLSVNYTDITPMLTPRAFPLLEGVEFCGSLVRASFYPCTPDKFYYVDVDLPPRTVYVNGVQREVGLQSEYLAGKITPEDYSNVYGDFWGKDYALIWYNHKIDPQRNLLLIGDSYSNSLDMFVAAHYQNTYVVDLRSAKDFSIKEMITKYQIDDVLVLGSAVVLYNQAWIINP